MKGVLQLFFLTENHLLVVIFNMKIAGKFPAARWTRVFRPAQNQSLLIYFMLIVIEIF